MATLLVLVSCGGPVKQTKREFAWLSDDEVSQVLKQQFEQWQGTPYRFGGNNRQGIDCSAFVQNVMSNGFDFKLPRTTLEQQREGFTVARRSLSPGDLVFFTVPPRTPHVGIYVGQDRFIHAASTVGVSFGDLNDPYWRSKYITAKRVLPFMRE